MKKRLQGLVAGILIGVVLSSSFAFAKQIVETAELYYNNIKIYIDGAEIVPKDVNGNLTEPYTMNGTTYLPVRALANAFGKEVEWDGETQSVYIGKKDQTKPDNYLDKIQYNDYKESAADNDFVIINGTITDYRENTYTNGLLFWIDWHRGIENDSDEADTLVSYPLNSQYKNLKGNIVIPKKFDLLDKGEMTCRANPTDVLFYGDGKLLYRAVNVTSSMPFAMDVNVAGVNQLQIKVKTEYGGSGHVALTDLALYK